MTQTRPISGVGASIDPLVKRQTDVIRQECSTAADAGGAASPADVDVYWCVHR